MINPDKLRLFATALFSIRQASGDLHAAMSHMPMEFGLRANETLRGLDGVERQLERLLHEQTRT